MNAKQVQTVVCPDCGEEFVLEEDAKPKEKWQCDECNEFHATEAKANDCCSRE